MALMGEAKRDTYRARLQADSSGVKRDTLSDKCNGLGVFGRRTLVMANGFKIFIFRDWHESLQQTPYISRIFAGSEVPCVTDRKVCYRHNESSVSGALQMRLTMFFSAAQAMIQ